MGIRGFTKIKGKSHRVRAELRWLVCHISRRKSAKSKNNFDLNYRPNIAVEFYSFKHIAPKYHTIPNNIMMTCRILWVVCHTFVENRRQSRIKIRFI